MNKLLRRFLALFKRASAAPLALPLPHPPWHPIRTCDVRARVLEDESVDIEFVEVKKGRVVVGARRNIKAEDRCELIYAMSAGRKETGPNQLIIMSVINRIHSKRTPE